MLPPLTKRQKEILDFIENTIKTQGYAPSLQEIRDKFKLKAISTIHEHLENLKNKGYIKKDMNQSRGIQIIKNSKSNKYLEVKIKGFVKNNKVRFQRNSTDTIILDKKQYDPKLNYYILSIKDDSMKKQGFEKNDYLIIKESEKGNTKDLVIKKNGETPLIESLIESEKIEGKIVGLLRKFK